MFFGLGTTRTKARRHSVKGAPIESLEARRLLSVGALDTTFRERWNDGSRSFGMEVPNSNAALPLISSAEAAGATAGSCSVQTLRTYGITTADRGYSWSPTGEFTFWAAYLRAIKTASNYIYIEDQYFLAAGAPPLCLSTPDTTPIPPNPKRDVDLIYQLGAALKRGVKVVIVTPSNAEDIVHAVIKYQRDLGLEYLYERDAGAGNLVVASLEQGRGPVYVHSKLLVVDDEFVIIGSGNVGQRSVSCDGELSIGVVDEAEQFARTVRTTMWAEHLRLQPGDVTDVDATMDLFRRNQGRIRPYPYATPSKRPTQYVNLLTQVVDPYYGPPDLSPI